MKKFLRALLLCCVLASLSVTAWAAELEAMTGSGECGADGDNVTWTLDRDGVLTISGTGAVMEDENSENYLPWQEYRHYITAIFISDGITKIPDYAFRRCDYLESVTFGKNIKSTGQVSFGDCERLNEISWGGIEEIGEDAFSGCIALESVEIVENIGTVGHGAFYGCTSLNSVQFAGDMELIGNLAFYGCTSLNSVQFAGSTERIGESAFFNCGFTNLTLSNVKEMESGAFAYNENLERLTISGGISFLDAGVFYNCDALKTVTIDTNVTAIDETAFQNCGDIDNVYYSGTAAQWNKIRGGGADDLVYRSSRVYFECTGPDDAPAATVELSNVRINWRTVSCSVHSNCIQRVFIIAAVYDEQGKFLTMEECNDYTIMIGKGRTEFSFDVYNFNVQDGKSFKVMVLDPDFVPLCHSSGGTWTME